MDTAKKNCNSSCCVFQMLCMVHNIVQILGWGYELLLILQLWIEKGTIVLDIMNYQPLFYNLKLVQLLQFFDVFFGIVGVTKSNVLFSFLQIFGRNFIVLAVFEYNFPSKMHIISIIPWCFADLIRYCYYLVSDVSFLEFAQPLCKWLRLSGFLILYPIGATGELLSIYDSWNILSEKRRISKIIYIIITKNVNLSILHYRFSNLK